MSSNLGGALHKACDVWTNKCARVTGRTPLPGPYSVALLKLSQDVQGFFSQMQRSIFLLDLFHVCQWRTLFMWLLCPCDVTLFTPSASRGCSSHVLSLAQAWVSHFSRKPLLLLVGFRDHDLSAGFLQLQSWLPLSLDSVSQLIFEGKN